MMRAMHAQTRSSPHWAFIVALAMGLITPDANAILIVNEPWVRVAADGRSAEIYMRLKSTEGATLVAVTSFAADKVALRAPGTAKGAVGELPLPAHTQVDLRSNDYRITLTGLTRRIKLGEHVPLTLTIRSADGLLQEVPINAEVRKLSPTDDESHPHGHREHAQ
jgi:periplasmic copper chaperone A